MPMHEISKISIERIKNHSLCKLRGHLEENSRVVPPRLSVRRIMMKGATTLLLNGLGKPEISRDIIPDVVDKVFAGVSPYQGKESDISAAEETYINLANMISMYELEIVDVRRDFEVAYNGHIVSSYIDGVVLEKPTMRRLPFILDYTRARYEVQYTQAVYHAQTVADLYDMNGPTTRVLILAIGSGKKWQYNHDLYGPDMRESIGEMVDEINMGHTGMNVGMHCTWCPFLGICHTSTAKKKK